MQRTPRQLHASHYFHTLLNKLANGENEMIIAGKTYKIGRDAKTGQFIPKKEAQRRKNTTVVETLKKKGK